MQNDKSQYSGYNRDDGEIVEKIDFNNLKQVNDKIHDHVWVRDPEETDTYYAMKCAHPRCFRGYLVAKDVKPD
jgi:hypothetical protein